MQLFQSTPTGFPAGDCVRVWSRPQRDRFQSTPTGFPAGDITWRSLAKEYVVSIHADRFPGRRLFHGGSLAHR